MNAGRTSENAVATYRSRTTAFRGGIDDGSGKVGPTSPRVRGLVPKVASNRLHAVLRTTKTLIVSYGRKIRA